MRVGIDLGGMSIKAGLVDDEYNIVKKDSVVTDTNSGEQIIKDIITSSYEAFFAEPEFSCDNAAGVAYLSHLRGKL